MEDIIQPPRKEPEEAPPYEPQPTQEPLDFEAKNSVEITLSNGINIRIHSNESTLKEVHGRMLDLLIKTKEYNDCKREGKYIG